MKQPTKADLAAAVAKLTAENAALRSLLAAVSLAADTVPVSKGNDYAAEWQRSCRVLSNIKILSRIDGDRDGELAYAAEELRSIAAEDPGYEVYVAFAEAAPEKADDAATHPQGNPYPDGTPWCAACSTHHQVPAEQPASVTA